MPRRQGRGGAGGEAASPGRPARRRRRPEEARRLLLDAAQALIAERGPDAVSLRDVAEAVGVTPGLVTHYFGTYRGLAREVLRRQERETGRALEAQVAAAAAAPEAQALLAALFAAATEPRRARLFAWARLRGGPERSRTRGLAALVSALQRAFRRTLPAAEVPPRARIEAVALLALAASHGWALGRGAWLAQLGRARAGRAADRAFLASLTRALRLLMAAPGRGTHPAP